MANQQPGRNDPCPCGSGKKFKHCCEGKPSPRPVAPAPADFDPLIALYNAGRYAELESRMRLMVEQFPDSAFAWKLLGGALLMQGKEALPAFQKTAALLPGDAEAHYNLGVALKNLGRLEEAVASYGRALAIKPDYAEAYSNLGSALDGLGQFDEAVTSYQRALAIKPNSAEAHNNLGITLKNLGHLEEAVACYHRALAIHPHYAEAHSNLGNALNKLGQHDSAVSSCRQALELRPDYAEAYNNLGNALQDLGQFNEAMACHRRALELKPDYAESHNNLANALKDLWQFDEAVASYHRAMKFKKNFTDAYTNLLLTLNYTANLSPSAYLAEARLYGQMAASQVSARFTTWQCETHPTRLRVGIVSGDLRSHSVGHFLESLLLQLDPARIELFAYPTQGKEDALTARIKPCFAAWRPLTGLSDPAAAQLIHNDGVHVLLDLSGHTALNRLPLFAWKPAPVQCTWLGLPATSGLTEMDYILGDQWTLPDDEAPHYVEKGWRLSVALGCLTPPTENTPVAALPALQNKAITFGTLNNPSKMNDAVVARWARLLRALPDSRLYLNSRILRDEVIRQKITQRYAEQGIAENRLILDSTTGRAAALQSYNQIDVALDPFPYPGGTTSYEALWMGVPVLTQRGNSYISHLGESIMCNAGLPDWVANDEDDYVAKAIALTADLERLASLRANLRQQVLASPLFDAPRFAKNFEEALWGMWQQHPDLPEK